jgi:hypothetical protein
MLSVRFKVQAGSVFHFDWCKMCSRISIDVLLLYLVLKNVRVNS